MTENQMRAAFEHCDPARYQEFYNTVRVLAARPDINLRREGRFLLLSADEVEVCERVMALSDAFRVGIEYGEAMKNA